MLTKIKAKVLEAVCDYYAKKSAYYYDKALVCYMEYQFEKADRYVILANQYLAKHCGLTVQLVRLA